MGGKGEGAEERGGGRGSGLVMPQYLVGGKGEGVEERGEGGRGSGLIMLQYWWEVRGRGGGQTQCCNTGGR